MDNFLKNSYVPNLKFKSEFLNYKNVYTKYNSL